MLSHGSSNYTSKLSEEWLTEPLLSVTNKIIIFKRKNKSLRYVFLFCDMYCKWYRCTFTCFQCSFWICSYTVLTVAVLCVWDGSTSTGAGWGTPPRHLGQRWLGLCSHLASMLCLLWSTQDWYVSVKSPEVPGYRWKHVLPRWTLVNNSNHAWHGRALFSRWILQLSVFWYFCVRGVIYSS